MAVKFKVRMPKELKDNLFRLRTARMNAVVRLAFRAGNRIQRKEMKKLVRQVRSKSDRSTGATHRAVVTKVRYPGKRSHSGYAMVGISRAYTETHFRDPNWSGDRKSARLYGVANFGRPAWQRKKNGKRKRIARKIVKSYQKTDLRFRKGTKPRQKNRPAAYWHLINEGKKKKHRFAGYKFVQRATRSTEKAVGAKVTEIITNGITRELKKK